MDKHLAIDIGAASGRAFVGWLDDGRLQSREIHRFVTGDVFLVDKRFRNIFRFYEEILEALRLYGEREGRGLRSLGVDSFGCDFTLLNRNGEIARLIPSYRDSRMESVEQIVDQTYGSYRLYQRNGNHSLPSDTLQQLIRLRRAGDPALDDPGALLFVAEAFHYMLGGRIANEYSQAGYSRFYNVHDQDWDDEVMRAFGLPAALKTEVVFCGDVVGTLRQELAAEAGLDTGTEIICPCCHDTSSAALAVPDPGDDWIFISSGSWSLLGTETAAPICGEQAWRHNFSNSGMPVGTSNMFKKNITGMWLIQEAKRCWKRYGEAEMIGLAEDAPDNDWYIDVNSMEFYSPADMPLAVAARVRNDFRADVGRDDVGPIVRVCLHSLALKYRYYLDLLREITGKTINKIYILGGGSRNTLLNQMTANATGLPVYTGVYEGSVTGNLLLQMYGSGRLSSKAAMRRIVIDSFPQTEWSPREVGHWERKYQRYREAMRGKGGF